MSICVNSAGDDVQVFMTVAVVEVHAPKCQFFGHFCSCRLLTFDNTLEISVGRGTHEEIMEVLSPSYEEQKCRN
jgi:hypothetical protein